jgi:hypothetical protein
MFPAALALDAGDREQIKRVLGASLKVNDGRSERDGRCVSLPGDDAKGEDDEHD